MKTTFRLMAEYLIGFAALMALGGCILRPVA